MDIISTSAALAVITAFILVIYIVYMSRNNGVFKRLSVMGPGPWPAVGNFPQTAKLDLFEFHRTYYQKYAGQKVYGYFDPGTPLMVIRDLDMLRDITIKYFNTFVNRKAFFSQEKPFDHMMMALKDDHWRNVRHTVSPAFSSGKLRKVCLHVEETSRVLTSNMREFCESGKEVELKYAISCYTMDVIASTGFGVNVDSVRDSSSPFVNEAKKIMGFSGRIVSFVVLFPLIIKIMNKFGFGVFPKESVGFFSSFVDQALQNRIHDKQAHNRNDFLQLLVNKKLSHEDIQGQAIIFILAGYDTIASVLSFSLFAIAHHPEVCQRLQKELDTVLEGKSPTYDSIQGLDYLDMCLDETMRLFPPAIFVDRVCQEECVIQGVKIPKGMTVMIPIFAIQRSPDYWPDPDRFDPERFTAENKAGRHPFAHIPFGQGPRNCIGMRLALLEMKVAIASILQEMTPVPCEKSVYPVKLSKYQMKAEDALWVKMVSRNKK